MIFYTQHAHLSTYFCMIFVLFYFLDEILAFCLTVLCFLLGKIRSARRLRKAKVFPNPHVQFRLELQEHAHQEYQSQGDHQVLHCAIQSSPLCDR